MAWTHYQLSLAALMVISGSFNSLSVKYADQQTAVGTNGVSHKFNHPFMQSSVMFFGEMLCFIVFKVAYYYYYRKDDGSVDSNSLTKGSQIFNPLILLLPAMCDMLATSIMYVGLNMTYVSSFQMLRGAVIVFTGILSTAFLNRKFGAREWTGIGFVILGLALVGMSDILARDNEGDDINSILTGDLLIICAQVITAVQMVIEEKLIAGQDIPALQAVGWEGIFGFIGICLLMIPLNFIHASPPFADNPRGTLEDTVDAFVQIGNNSYLFMTIVGIAFSIAFFNFAGISVTKEISATTRMILDSIRTIVIWIFSLLYGWQVFHYLQLIGFTLLLIGMCCYNNVVIPQLTKKFYYRYIRRQRLSDQERFVNIAADEVDNIDNADT